MKNAHSGGKGNFCVLTQQENILSFHRFLRKGSILKRLLLTILPLVINLSLSATALPEQEVTISGSNMSLVHVFNEIVRQTNCDFFYNDELLKSAKPVSIHVKNASLNHVLDLCFKDQPLTYLIVGKTIVVKYKPDLHLSAMASSVISPQVEDTIMGRVTDQAGQPLPGVTVSLRGSQIGTITDPTGNYRLVSQDSKGTLVFTYIGYVEQQIPVNGRTTINIQMARNVSSLDQLVVVAYGTNKKSDLTGAISSIDGQVVSGKAVSSVDQIMQGKAPGVQIHYDSGEPGAPMQVQIRGVGSFGNSDPLYVVDGVPMKSEDMATINPNIIQSIEVLKDASAAAIYGARAANGVVLITTKSGSQGQMHLDYNGYYGIQLFNQFFPMLNSNQYADVVNESSKASGYPMEAAYNDPENLKHNTDWQRAAFHNAPMTNHSLSISGGSDKAIYSLNGDYLYQEGIFVFNNLKRYSANINTKFNVTNKLTVGETMLLSRTSGLNRHLGNNHAFVYLLAASPTMRIYDDQNEGGYAGPNPAQTGINNRGNIILERDLSRTQEYINRVVGNFYAEYEFLPGLKDRMSYGFNAHMNESKQFTPTYEAGNRTNRVASLSNSDEKHAHTLLQNLLTYDHKIGKSISLSLLGGFSQELDVQTNLAGHIQDFPSNELQVIDAGTGSFTVAGNKNEYSLRSFFARANMVFKDRYLFTGTFRRDGSSRFGKENRYGNFPSLALGWIVSRENFMKDIPVISQLKVRASWGELGNQEIANYVNQNTVSTSPRYILGDDIAPGAAPVNLGNPALKWESTAQTDVGVDLGLFNDRLVFTGDYYIKNTRDILLRVPISGATGIDRDNGPYQNAAGMKNTGFDFSATYYKASKDFSYNLSANISVFHNRVTSLGGESSIINLVENSYGYGGYTYTAVGNPISSYFGYIFEGIFQDKADIDAHANQPGAQPGDVKFKDINGDGIIDANDRTIIGNPFPQFSYGFSGQASYGNFDASLSFQGVQGRELYNSQRAFLESLTGEHNQLTSVLQRWHGKGTSNTMPRAVRDDPNDNTRPSTRFLENASYLRLQSFQVGYSFPQSFLQRLGVRSLRIYANTQNLFTWTAYKGYNPDVRGGDGSSETTGNPLTIGIDNGSYPLSKVFQFGVQLGLN